MQTKKSGNGLPLLRHLRRDSRGFTIIELATVIIIIGTLATMVVEGVQKARTRARTVHCVVNQRNIYQTAFLYGAENFVPAGNVNVLLMSGAGYTPAEMGDCPSSDVADGQDYDVFFVGGAPATITCLIQGFVHQYTP